MMNRKDREIAPLKQALKDVTPQKYSLDLDKAINELDLGLSLFRDEELTEWGLYCCLAGAWREANENEVLRKMIEEKIEEMRQRPELILDEARELMDELSGVTKNDDLIGIIYDPTEWPGRIPKGREKDFALKGMRVLRGLFVSLSPKEQPKPVGQQG